MATKPKNKPQVKRPVGRPNTYDPKYCAQLLDYIKEDPLSNSFDSFSLQIDVTRKTLYEWKKVFPEFCDAMDKSIEIRKHAMEKIGRDFVTGKNRNGNAQVYQFFMRNWFKDSYVERVEMKQEIEATVETGLTDEFRQALAALREIPPTSKT